MDSHTLTVSLKLICLIVTSLLYLRKISDTSHVPNLSNFSPLPDIPSLRINTEGVTHLLLDIDPYKSTGPDNIPAKFLKETAVQIAPALSLIFQASN